VVHDSPRPGRFGQRVMSRRTAVQSLAATAVVPLVTSTNSAAAATRPTQRTVLFDAAAFYEPTAASWVLPLHAWVHTPADSIARKAAIAALFKAKYGLDVTDATRATFDQRINVLLADNMPNDSPRIMVDDLAYRLPATAANGHTRFEAVLKGPPDDTALPNRISSPTSEALAFVQRVTTEGVSIISDIDDTVKDSGVLDKRRLWESTFFKPFRAVPGMASLVTRLAGAERVVHYVSSSPWHLYEPLRSWLITDGFPVTELHLKHIRLKDTTILDILKSPEKTKPPLIAGILRRFPRRRFVLIGDSGEKDPEVYGAVARQFSGQVTRVLIRRAPGDTSASARFAQAFDGLQRDLWQVFDDPADVA
jgi:hypothetical protein